MKHDWIFDLVQVEMDYRTEGRLTPFAERKERHRVPKRASRQWFRTRRLRA
ncbi:hypothetical protein [Amycolatopsis sp. NPDC059021]|uniref:hypothetical protein n=1 Tax=Amycolatopsis sp. NPDC059021 TaxID=3346704 RepID=UPI00366A6807